MFPKSIAARLSASVSLALSVAILAAVAWTQWIAPERTRPASAIGGAFKLTNTAGETVTARDLRGRYLMIFFGYTHCPDVCPMTLNAMTQALDVIGESTPEVAQRVTPVFITVDPARDNVARMREYLANFHPRTIGLTGTPEAITEAAAAYHVASSRVDPEKARAGKAKRDAHGDHASQEREATGDHADMRPGNVNLGEPDPGAYLMQHSSYVFLMGPDGDHVSHVNATAGAPRIAEMIRTQVKP